jgi:jumonji domain-containing protein 7
MATLAVCIGMLSTFQNSNLTDEFRSLIDDTREPAWAREAFGKEPDAINFWMGDSRCLFYQKLQVLVQISVTCTIYTLVNFYPYLLFFVRKSYKYV